MRLGVEYVMRQKLENVYYWPSFEIVRWLAPHVGRVFGVDGQDNRHPKPALVTLITQMFIKAYFGLSPR
jgi:hypothetical protein